MTGLTGYGTGGVLDQAASWFAIIDRMRAWDPVGDDVDSLKSWHAQVLAGALPAQFVPTILATQPTLGTAAWAILAATAGAGLLDVDPPLPSLFTGLSVDETEE